MDKLHTFQHHQKQVNSLWNFYSIYIRMTVIEYIPTATSFKAQCQHNPTTNITINAIPLRTLHDLGWWIVMIVVRLVVLVPFKARLHTVEEPRLSLALRDSFRTPQQQNDFQ